LALLDKDIKKYILNFGGKWGFSADNKIENENGNLLGKFIASSEDEYGEKQVLDSDGTIVFTIKKKFSFTSFKEPHKIKMPSGEHIGNVRRGKRWGYGKDMWVETPTEKILQTKVPIENEITEIKDATSQKIGHVKMEEFDTSEFLKGHPKSWILYVDDSKFDRLFLLALFLIMIHQRYTQNWGGGG